MRVIAMYKCQPCFIFTVLEMFFLRQDDYRFKPCLTYRGRDRNDEVLECIDIGRHFKNDTEWLEKLFDLYTKMTAENKKNSKSKKKVAKK